MTGAPRFIHTWKKLERLSSFPRCPVNEWTRTAGIAGPSATGGGQERRELFCMAGSGRGKSSKNATEGLQGRPNVDAGRTGNCSATTLLGARMCWIYVDFQRL